MTRSAHSFGHVCFRTFGKRIGATGLAFAALCGVQTARAQDLALPAPRSLHLSADPNAPNTFFIWRQLVRGQVSLNVPVSGTPFEDAASFNLQPLFEIHDGPNDSSPLRSPHWRGRLSAYGAWTWHSSTLLQLGAAHESDHYTARSDTSDEFLALNDVYAAATRVWSTPQGSLALRTALELYVWSCTDLNSTCRDFHGSTALGGDLGLVWDFRQSEPRGFAPFVAADVSGIAPHGAVLAERRVIVRAGAWTLGERGALWQLFALVFWGNDLGIARATRLTQWGLGAAYAP